MFFREDFSMHSHFQGRHHADFWVGGQIVGSVAKYPQNTLKSEKTLDLGHFILESGGYILPDFKSGGYEYPPSPVGDTPAYFICHYQRMCVTTT